MTNPFDFTSYADFLVVGALALLLLGGFLAMVAAESPNEAGGTTWMEDHPRTRKVFVVVVVLPTCVGLLGLSALVILARIAKAIT